MRSRLHLSFVVAALACVVVGCSPAATPTPSNSPATLATARPSASAGPSTGPEAEPSRGSIERPPLVWTRTGSMPDAGSVEAIEAFDGGYVATGHLVGDGGGAAAWSSADGVRWDRVDLGEPRECGGYLPSLDRLVTSSKGVVILGQESAGPGNGSDCQSRLVSWFSADGTAWRRGFDSEELIAHAPASLWAADGGWEAVIANEQGAYDLWRSTDGISWTRTAPFEYASELSSLVGADVDASGTRVVSVQDGDIDPPISSLLMSSDGISWQTALEPDNAVGVIGAIAAPDASRSNWTVIRTDYSGDQFASMVLASSDLVAWDSAEFPRGTTYALEPTKYGLMALGQDVCQVTGSPCAEPDRPARYYVTTNGLEWEPLVAAVGPERFAEGPNGVVGVDGTGSTWRLEELSGDEALLINGIRDDARVACTPRRADLPAGAVAGVECAPLGGPASQVGAYRFDSEDSLLETYYSRLEQEGIAPGTGDCPRSAGEMSYIPEQETDPSLNRIGCFVNEFGYGNLRFTSPEARVYVGVLGADGDMESLYDWAWQGNLDQPGSPTIWREPTTP